MEKITRQDLMALRMTGAPTLSPDGSRAVYTEQTQNQKENHWESRLFLADLSDGTTRQLTDFGKEGDAIWLDNDTLLFATVRGKADEPTLRQEKTCFYCLSLKGGEAMKAFEVDKNVLGIRLMPDGRFLLTVLENLNPPSPDMTDEELEEEKEYHVLEEIPAYANGRGYISRLRYALYIYDRTTGEKTKVSGEYFNVLSADVSDKYILYTGKEYDTCPSIKGWARLYDLTTGETKDLLPAETYTVNGAWLHGEQAVIAMTDNEPWGMSQYADLYAYDLASGDIRLLTKMDMTMHGWISIDCNKGHGNAFKVVDDELLFIGQEKYYTSVFAADMNTGALRCAVPCAGVICSFDTVNGVTVINAAMPDDLADLYQVTGSGLTRLTNANAALLKDKYVGHARHIPFVNDAGVTIDGWVLEPMDFDPAKRYPGVLHVHGGPRGAYGNAFNHQMQMLAGEGYFVFWCNPRGGEGYGEAFADLRGKYGTIDFEDVMAFTDHVLALYPQLDGSRLGETGGSYGGFMSNWIEGHTDRFAAIVSCCSISNWVADFVACEFGYTFDGNEVGATPWTDMLKMWDQSPLKYADKAKTPILFMQSLCDYNCPMDQGTEMFIAMKYHGVPSRMVVFEGENHSLSSSGRPKQRLRRLKEMQAWFDKYLKA